MVLLIRCDIDIYIYKYISIYIYMYTTRYLLVDMGGLQALSQGIVRAGIS